MTGLQGNLKKTNFTDGISFKPSTMERNKETQERNMVWTQDIHIYNPKQLQLVVIAATSSVKYNFSEWLFKYAQLVFV